MNPKWLLVIFAVVVFGLLVLQDLRNAQKLKPAPAAAPEKQKTPDGCIRVLTLTASGVWAERFDCPKKPAP